MFHHGRDKRQFLRTDLQAREDLGGHIHHQDSKDKHVTTSMLVTDIGDSFRFCHQNPVFF